MINLILPSGLEGRGAHMVGQAIVNLADEMARGDDELSDSGMKTILGGSWLETVHPGPYPFISKGTTQPDWGRLGKCDVISALLQVRVGSFRDGNVYVFETRCPKQAGGCGHKIVWQIDLVKDVLSRKRELSDAGKANFADGTYLETKVFTGATVAFDLPRLDHDRPMAKLKKAQRNKRERKSKDDTLVDMIGAIVRSVDGEPLKQPRDRFKWAAGAALQDLYDIRDAVNRNDAGHDIEITVECPDCFWEFDQTLPFGASFLDPLRLTLREKLYGQVPGKRTVALRDVRTMEDRGTEEDEEPEGEETPPKTTTTTSKSTTPSSSKTETTETDPTG